MHTYNCGIYKINVTFSMRWWVVRAEACASHACVKHNDNHVSAFNIYVDEFLEQKIRLQ